MTPEGEKPVRGKTEAWYEPHEVWEGRYPRTMLGLGYGLDRALLRKTEAWYEPHEVWEGRYPRTMLGLGYGLDRALLRKILQDDANMVDKKMLYNEDRATAAWVYLEQEEMGVKNIDYIDIPALTGYGESVWDLPTTD